MVEGFGEGIDSRLAGEQGVVGEGRADGVLVGLEGLFYEGEEGGFWWVRFFFRVVWFVWIV